MYHYIRDDDIHDSTTVHNLSIPPSLFDAQMREVGKLRDESIINLMYGEDFIESWKSNCFKNKKIWVFTTDDSWSDTYTTLAPIARKYSIPFFF
jgi:peptidoglycan/xylan/chitin deacetylase (PgdA/CDA1 family)